VLISSRTLNDQVVLSVSDSGVGIAERDLAHLFEPYWKGSGTGRRGTGLGLFVAFGIIEAHGGKLWVESTLGVGSTFTLSLPLRRELPAKAPKTAPEAEPKH
jgi:two-component system NtrC family sensor kinase